MQQSYSLKPEIEKAMRAARDRPEPFPWGFGSGLLTGCIITLIGVAMNLEPFTIMSRAAGGGAAVGGIVSVISLIWRLMSPRDDED